MSAAQTPEVGRLGKFRLAVVTSNPIQYNAPFFRELAKEPSVDLTVIYATLLGAEMANDPDLATRYSWDVDLLDGYHWEVSGTIRPVQEMRGWGLFSPKVVPMLWRGDFDAAFIYGWGDWQSRPAVLACRARRIPYLLTGDSAPIFAESPFKGAMKHLAVGWVVRHASACLYTGALQRVFYERFGVRDDRLFFHPWGTDNARFFELSDEAAGRRSEVRKNLGLAEEIPIVVFAGKLIPRKRPGDLVSAIGKLQADGVDCGLAFIGDGVLRAELEQQVIDEGVKNVQFLGFVNQSALPETLTACDVLSLPSEKEPRGVVINEAMSCGLPVVISHRSADWGPGDIVQEGQTGFIHTVGDVDGLANDCLRPLLTDSVMRKQMGAAARERMKTWGIAERVAGTLEAIEFLKTQPAWERKHRSDL